MSERILILLVERSGNGLACNPSGGDDESLSSREYTAGMNRYSYAGRSSCRSACSHHTEDREVSAGRMLCPVIVSGIATFWSCQRFRIQRQGPEGRGGQ